MSELANKIKEATTQAASAGLIVQKYCNGIIQQIPIAIPASIIKDLPDVNAHLTLAQGNARNYLDVIQPQIISVVTDVSAYSNQFVAFYTIIDKKIELWKGGSNSAKAEAMQLITALNGEVLIKHQNVTKVQVNLQGFQSALTTDVGHFNDALSKANIVIGGDHGRLATIATDILGVEKSINKLIGGLVGSVLGIVGGAVLILVGALVSIPTAGVGAGLVIAGAILLVAGIGGTIGTSVALDNAYTMKRTLLLEQAQLNESLTFLHSFTTTMNAVESSASNASAQLSNMRNAWNFLGQKLGNLGKDLAEASSFGNLPVLTQAWLSTAKEEWGGTGGVLATCANIEQQMTGVNVITMKAPRGGLALITPENIEKAIQNIAA